MTPLDLAIVVFSLLFGLFGIARGFLIGAISLAGFVAGAWLGSRFGPDLLNVRNTSPYAPIFGLGGALIGGLLGSAVAERVAGRLRGAIRIPGFSVLDGALGFIFSVGLALGLAWLISVILLQTPRVRQLRSEVQRSVILSELNAVLPSDTVLRALARFDPFPHVAGPDANVGPPRSAIARDRDVVAGGASVVRILGTACGLGVAGSGWVGPGGLVVTAAHVVAGQEDTVVQLRGVGRRLRATAVAFDPHNDIAVLRVPGLSAPPLGFSRASGVGGSGAALGFPLNGPYAVSPARIGATRAVTSQDAYGRGPALRSITAFRGTVRPGNSGGPLVDADGRVAGTVFAKSIGRPPAGGYAVPDDIARRTLRAAHGAVSTGPCAR